MSAAFWAGAAALAAVALGFLLVPLWRERRHSGRWPSAALIAACATVPAAVGLYLVVTTWDPQASGGASAEERAMVAQLAAKMVENPGDVEGWRLLGRSYMVLGEYALGRQAYIEAWNRTPNPDNALKLALGEALILSDRASITAEGGQLVEEVLRAEPNNPRALWYGGLVAMQIGRNDAARARWTRFLEFDNPEEIESTVRRLLAQLPPAAGPGQAGASGSAAARTGSDDAFALEIEIRVAEDVPLDALGPNAALFILARPPGERMPVAVIREPVDALPGTFTLSDRDAMIAGRSLAAYPELSLVARVSPTGEAAERSGDLYAETVYRQGEDPEIALVIDQVVP